MTAGQRQTLKACKPVRPSKTVVKNGLNAVEGGPDDEDVMMEELFADAMDEEDDEKVEKWLFGKSDDEEVAVAKLVSDDDDEDFQPFPEGVAAPVTPKVIPKMSGNRLLEEMSDVLEEAEEGRVPKMLKTP